MNPPSPKPGSNLLPAASTRARLGGRRALSWQAVAIGDALIVVLATTLAAFSAAGRSGIEAAVDVFAITMATAVVVAGYAWLAHVTVMRNRSRHPVPVPVAVGFHLSIGVIFLLGFAAGAAILAIPPLGSGPAFSIAVLMGGLLVCLPASLLLDHSDRYRERRIELIDRLAELEKLRISEWSLRRALRDFISRLGDDTSMQPVIERLDVMEMSGQTRLSTSQWWQVSVGHHGHSGEQFEAQLDRQVSAQFPLVSWIGESRAVFQARLRFPIALLLVMILLVWLNVTIVESTSVALPIALVIASGAYAWFAHLPWRRSATVAVSLIVVSCWAAVVAVIGSIWLRSPGSTPSVIVIVIAALAMTGAIVSILLVTWISAVISARESQLSDIEVSVVRHREESDAVFASLASVVAALAATPPLSDSAAMAACATGLQKVRKGIDAQHARRIIDWTTSIVSTPGNAVPVHLAARIDEVVHPWRALANITVVCPRASIEPNVADSVLAIIDEAVRNACRHGEAENIEISVTTDGGSGDEIESHIAVEILDDGLGPGYGTSGVAFERFATVGTGGLEVNERVGVPGTRVRVQLT